MKQRAAVLDNASPRSLGSDHELRVALVGLGAISRFHLLALRSIPRLTIVGGCDSDQRRRDFACGQWGIAVYASITELLSAARVDVLHILVPPSRHVEVGLEGLSQGCHLFMEKPMGISSSDCRLLEEAAVAHRCIVGVNHNQRWNPAFVSLLKRVASDYLGQIKNVAVHQCIDTPLVRGHWAAAARFNPVLEMGPHPLSLIIELLGPVRAASAHACQTQNPSAIPVVSSWQADLSCETGRATCFVSIGDTYQECSIVVIGEDGAARVDLHRNLLQVWTKSRFSPPLDNVLSAICAGSATVWQAIGNFAAEATSILGVGRGPGNVFSRGFQASIADFYMALRLGHSPSVGICEGKDVVEACEKVIAALVKSGC